MEKPENNPYIHNPDTDFKKIEKLDEKEAIEQVKTLREAINYHDYRYYVENNPILSDKIYDRLFQRLKNLEKEFGLESPNSPTKRIGGEPIDEFETVEHVSKMLSLESSEKEEDVLDFDNRVKKSVGEVEYHCEPKLDGISVEIVYENGNFSRAVTRGNGIEGEDISENVKTIGSVLLNLKEAPDLLALRGEIYIPKDGFQKINSQRVEKGKDPFSNPRNAVAGTVRQLDPKVVADRPLDVYFYEVLETTDKLETHKEAINLIKSLGLRINEKNTLVDSIDDFIKYRNKMMKKRDDLKYDIDGVVAKVNSRRKREELGETSTHPRWAYAYKFPAKTGETIVREITVQVGRTGKLTPVALFDPIDVNGVTISQATLHNEKQAKELGIKEGSKIKIERAGDVIPEVKEVTENKSRGSFRMPSKCPVCNSEVIKEGEYHFCTGGISCPSQLKRSLIHYGSKNAMDIEGLGEKVVDKLVESGLVASLSDLYNLEKEDLKKLENFGEKKSKKLLKQIENSKETTLSRFLTGLGIRHVGKETARILSKNFTLSELKKADKEELKKIPEIGPKVAMSIVSFFEGKGGEILDELLELGIKPKREKYNKILDDLKIVITGSIEGYTREELIDLLEKNGANVTSSVSSETDYLVVGENPGEVKVENAEKYDIDILREDKFKDKILDKIL